LMAGQTTFAQLAALLRCCQLALGSDSGPLHLASAVGTPTVHLFGPASPGKFGPWGDTGRHIVLTSDWPCAGCERLDWAPEALAHHRCMESIQPESVLQAAEALLDRPA